MPLKKKGEIENPKIKEDYYMSRLTNIKTYTREDKSATGLILEFEIDGEDVELPFFAPAKLSISEDQQSSRLAENLQNIDALEVVLDELGFKDEVMSEDFKWEAEDGVEAEDLVDVLEALFRGGRVRVNVEDSRKGDSSQISKLSQIFDEENNPV